MDIGGTHIGNRKNARHVFHLIAWKCMLRVLTCLNSTSTADAYFSNTSLMLPIGCPICDISFPIALNTHAFVPGSNMQKQIDLVSLTYNEKSQTFFYDRGSRSNKLSKITRFSNYLQNFSPVKL